MLDAETREDLIETITAIFTNEADASEFNEDPDAYVDEHLPEGTEGADVTGVLPDVAERTGLDFSNVASTGGGASAAGQISHTYQTIYQQNSYIYAEEGSQVTNVQGDGNAVAQQDVDVDIDVEYGEGEDDVKDEAPETTPEQAVEEATEATELADAEPLFQEQGLDPGDPYYEPPVQTGGEPVAEEPWDGYDEPQDPPAAEAPAEAPEADPYADVVDAIG
jgi:hypothetical protein